MKKTKVGLILTLTIALFAPLCVNTQATTSSPPAAQNTILLTAFLKHDQSKTLDQLEDQLKRTGFYRDFPPAGTEIVSWYVMMGVGQVVTLRLPPEKLRDVNRYFEQRAWGAFRTEFYPTSDFKQAFQELKQSK